MKRPSAFTDPRHNFQGVLLLIVAALVFQMAAPDADWSRLVAIALQGAVLIAALIAGGARQRIVRGVSIGVAVLLVLSTATVFGASVGGGGPRLISLLLVLIAPAGIVIGIRRGVIEDERVSLQTVYGGLCIYLLAGLAYSFSFSLIQDVGGDPFFAGGVDGDPNDFLYFSLVTLSTTGYGDFTAASEFGRTIAVTEAVAGQVYLVTVVALLVSNLGRARPSGPVLSRLADEGKAESESSPSAGRGQEPGPG
jgi:hypothetical protein